MGCSQEATKTYSTYDCVWAIVIVVEKNLMMNKIKETYRKDGSKTAKPSSSKRFN